MLDFLSIAAVVCAAATSTRTPEAGALFSVRRFRVGRVVSTSTTTTTARLESGNGVCNIPEKLSST